MGSVIGQRLPCRSGKGFRPSRDPAHGLIVDRLEQRVLVEAGADVFEAKSLLKGLSRLGADETGLYATHPLRECILLPKASRVQCVMNELHGFTSMLISLSVARRRLRVVYGSFYFNWLGPALFGWALRCWVEPVRDSESIG